MSKEQVTGGELLQELARNMVSAQREFFGKGPESAKAHIIDDLLFIVMRGSLTVAEHTMIDFDRPDEVRRFRQIFENEMAAKLTGMVEDLTGRKVVNYQSQIMFDPDVVVEMFVFDRDARQEDRDATAHGQLADDDTGEATADDV